MSPTSDDVSASYRDMLERASAIQRQYKEGVHYLRSFNEESWLASDENFACSASSTTSYGKGSWILMVDMILRMSCRAERKSRMVLPLLEFRVVSVRDKSWKINRSVIE